MANLMLTSRCNLDCNFCFALDIMGETSKTVPDVSFDTFRAYIDLLDRSGLGQARLLGGEPTLHPDFTRYLAYARSRGKTALIFSNGLIPDAVLDALVEVPSAECTVLVNLAAGEAVPAVRRRQEYALTRLGERSCPGYTILSIPSNTVRLRNISCPWRLRLAGAGCALNSTVALSVVCFRTMKFQC